MKLTCEWSDELGGYEYVFKTKNGTLKGDANWGQRIARHYKLPFPRQPEV